MGGVVRYVCRIYVCRKYLYFTHVLFLFSDFTLEFRTNGPQFKQMTSTLLNFNFSLFKSYLNFDVLTIVNY
jgi:hypothetical protein